MRTCLARSALWAAICTLLFCAATLPSGAQAPRGAGNGYALKELTTPEEIAAAKPNPQAPGFRVPLPTLEQMDPALRADYESNARRLKTPVPPTAPLMLTPELKNTVRNVSGAVAKTGLPKDLQELTIIVVARYWGSQFEWWVHAPQTVIEGVPAEAVEALRIGRRPTFATQGQEATYRYLVELLRDHEVSDATYENLRKIIGSQQLVATTELAGYYGRLAMSLVAHKLPLRADVKPPLPALAKTFP